MPIEANSSINTSDTSDRTRGQPQRYVTCFSMSYRLIKEEVCHHDISAPGYNWYRCHIHISGRPYFYASIDYYSFT